MKEVTLADKVKGMFYEVNRREAYLADLLEVEERHGHKIMIDRLNASKEEVMAIQLQLSLIIKEFSL